MICEKCGSYMPDDALTCDVCGSFLARGSRMPETGVRAIRQGRKNAAPPSLPDQPRSHIPEYGDYDMSPLPVEQERGVRRSKPKAALDTFASRPNTRRGVPVNTGVRTRQVVGKHGRAKTVRMHSVNWMLIGVIGLGLVIGAVVAYLVYMNTTDEGQRRTARGNIMICNESMLELAVNPDPLVMTEREELLKDWNKAPAQAYWLEGEDYMAIGDMADAITAFRMADILNPENYDGLLLLGSAYELDNNDAKAEELYLELIKEISPARAEAYTALINLYLDNERNPEAADLMLLAYNSTDRDSFRQQRRDFIPSTPQVDTDHLSGRYELEQTITVTSPQGYDIYYIFNNSNDSSDDQLVLPQDGQLVQNNAVVIPEGTFTLQAVCVSGDLVSDMLSVSYTVYYPTPPAPKCNLAPNTYSKLIPVSLRQGDSGETKEERRKKSAEQLEKQDTQTFYYTIDGSNPDPKISPIYDGTPIQMSTGNVTLRAIAVNGYGKQSSTMEVGYKFNCKPTLPKMYNETDDIFSGMEINKTTLADFKSTFGEPKSETSTTYLMQTDEAVHLEYSWGYAVFTLTNSKWVLVRAEMDSDVAGTLRGVGIGSSESEITAAFRDKGMPDNQDGSRNLYYDDPNIGKVLVNEDGSRTVQYACNTAENRVWVLQYHLRNGRCDRISYFYQP